MAQALDEGVQLRVAAEESIRITLVAGQQPAERWPLAPANAPAAADQPVQDLPHPIEGRPPMRLLLGTRGDQGGQRRGYIPPSAGNGSGPEIW